jgi:aryl-alcohol dehydrogenase-like predicted oxidoreductase
MEYRMMGDSSLRVPVMGFGTWALGGTQYGPIDAEQCMEALYRAIEYGVTLVDTAAVYGNGRAEKVLGKYMDTIRNDIVLVTKCGLDWDDEAGTEWRDGSRKRILEGIDESLERLQTSYVDLLLLHYADPKVPIQESIEALLEVRASGKARHVGVSNFNRGQIEEAIKVGGCIANQVPYNMLNRKLEKELFPLCAAHGIGVMTHGSLCSGLLSGAITPETTFEAWDWRSKQPGFRGEALLANLRLADRLKEVAVSLGKTLPQLALNWVINTPGVTTALFGVRTLAELEDNVGAVGWSIPEEHRLQILEILKETSPSVPIG